MVTSQEEGKLAMLYLKIGLVSHPAHGQEVG